MSTSSHDAASHGARTRILDRIRAANAGRTPAPHPGDFDDWRSTDAPADADPVRRFVGMFEATGGEVVRVTDTAEAGRWFGDFATSLGAKTLTRGRGVPPGIAPSLPEVDASEADVALSAARSAIAETGSLVLDARDGRRTQLLAPVHVVLVASADIDVSARDAFRSLSADLPAALGLHSGPSKSADIGQVMVKGVHGPGRLVALVIGSPPDE